MPTQAFPTAQPAAELPPHPPATGEPGTGKPSPAVLAGADASEPAELAVVVVRGYN